MTGTPRIVVVILVVGMLAAANRVTPGLVQAVLLLVLLYLVVTHSEKVGAALTGASWSFARAFGSSSAPRGGGGGAPPRVL